MSVSEPSEQTPAASWPRGRPVLLLCGLGGSGVTAPQVLCPRGLWAWWAGGRRKLPDPAPPLSLLTLFSDLAAELHQAVPGPLPALWEVSAGRPPAHLEGLPDPRGLPRHLPAVTRPRQCRLPGPRPCCKAGCRARGRASGPRLVSVLVRHLRGRVEGEDLVRTQHGAWPGAPLVGASLQCAKAVGSSPSQGTHRHQPVSVSLSEQQIEVSLSLPTPLPLSLKQVTRHVLLHT